MFHLEYPPTTPHIRARFFPFLSIVLESLGARCFVAVELTGSKAEAANKVC